MFLKVAKGYVEQYPEQSFKFTFDDWEAPVVGAGDRVTEVRFLHAEELLANMFARGSLPLGEGYCKGWIKVRDEEYKNLLVFLVRAINDRKILKYLTIADKLRVLKAKLSNKDRRHDDQKKNINVHYSLTDWFTDDQSNEFFMLWLNSPYVQYSCGKWDDETTELEEAQSNKFSWYARRLGLNEHSAGKTLLDLGCGWGGFMFYLYERFGLECTGITLSTAQTKYIQEESARRNIGGVKVQCEDVHDMEGEYDHIVSLGMLEHIDDYDDLYEKSRRSLKEGGTALFHSMHNDGATYAPDPFLLKYIFRIGATPELQKNVRTLNKYFESVDIDMLPHLSYPKTLDAWYGRYCRNEKQIRALLEKSSCGDVDFAVRVFKHYLVLASAGLTVRGGVWNLLLADQSKSYSPTA
jgi:cyclopropane-fatty-acyl-phospholipid synthase